MGPPIYYGYRLGYSLPGTRWLCVEGELIHGKLFADAARVRGAGVRNGAAVVNVPFSSVVDVFDLSHGLNFVLLNAVIRVPVRSDRLLLTARGGAGLSLPHAEIQVEGHRTHDYQLAGAAVQASGGVEARVWRRLSAVAEYKWTRAKPRISIDSGTAELTTRSHHVAFGIAAAF